MPKMPFYLVFLQSLPETALIISLGLSLIGVKLDARKIFIISLISSLASYLIRLMPIPPGINVLIQMPILVFLIKFIYKMPLKYSSMAAFIGLIIIFIGELTFNELMVFATGISLLEVLQKPFWRIVFPIPEFLSLAMLVALIKKKGVILFNIKEFVKTKSLNFSTDRSLFPTLSVLSLVILLTVIGMFNQTYIYGIMEQVGPKRLVISVNVVIIICTLAAVILVRTLYLAAKHEEFLKIQELHIGQLKELIKVITTQRHDFVNHLQSVYALLKIGQIQSAQNYIEDLYQEVKLTSEMLHLNCPELAAMLVVKSGVADKQGIIFTIEIESGLEEFKIKALDINTLIGNLIDNAFEAVIDLPNEKRKVFFKIFETPSRFVFQTSNPGYIPRDKINQIFVAGYSTKTGGKNKGLGLSSVKSAVEKNKGEILVNSNHQRGIVFTIFFPR